MVCDNGTWDGTTLSDTSIPTHWVYTLGGCVVTVLIMGTNSVTILVIAKEKSFWQPSGYFMVQLAVTDMTTGIFLTLFSIPASVMNKWPFGETFCSVAGLFGTSGASLSILTLALIAYDRYLVITKPFQYETTMTKKRALICLAVIWIFNMTFQAMPFAVPSWAPDRRYVYFPNSFVCSFAFHNNVIYVALTIGLIFLPACIVINYCCFKMYTTARSHAKAIQDQAPSLSEAKRSAKNLNALKTTALIIGAFFLAWGPFMIFCIYRAVLPCDQVKYIPRPLEFAVGMLAMSNSFMNFFIYSVRNRKFRESAKKVTCFGKCSIACKNKVDASNYAVASVTARAMDSADKSSQG